MEEVKILGCNPKWLNKFNDMELDNLSNDEIASKLKVHPYRVKLAINNLYSYSLEELTKNLNNLFILDKDIKTGLVNKKIAMELYLANL